MTHAEQIEAARAYQRQSASSGEFISLNDAKRAIIEQEKQQAKAPDTQLAAVIAENVKLTARIATLEQTLSSIRITGPGFSGQGARGIVFAPVNAGEDATGGGSTQIIAVEYDPDAGTVSARRMSGPLTDLGAYEG